MLGFGVWWTGAVRGLGFLQRWWAVMRGAGRKDRSCSGRRGMTSGAGEVGQDVVGCGGSTSKVVTPDPARHGAARVDATRPAHNPNCTPLVYVARLDAMITDP